MRSASLAAPPLLTVQNVGHAGMITHVHQPVHSLPGPANLMGDLAIGIIHVPKESRFGRAGVDACGPLLGIHSVSAQRALFDHTRFMVIAADTIRTCHHTILAANAPLFVHQDNTILPFVRCPGGTNSNAGGVITLLTEHGEKVHLHIGKLAGWANVQHIAPKRSQLDIVFLFAHGGACVAPDARIEVNHHRHSSHRSSPPCAFGRKPSTAPAGALFKKVDAICRWIKWKRQVFLPACDNAGRGTRVCVQIGQNPHFFDRHRHSSGSTSGPRQLDQSVQFFTIRRNPSAQKGS
jgi:hypothetical protein